ncbi:TPA: hypothetical protein ACRTTK_003097 [Aeromonas hydrophila]|uniref:hypothetical protein n=1 Tax=Aeromonas hydrophila TaxID=644 RepID=UPI0024434B32|nr:hypothetical protein [Aeromonas hydrophila]
MITHSTEDFNLGTIEPSGPAKFPLFMAGKMVRSKVNGSAIKTIVLVASKDRALLCQIGQLIDAQPDMARIEAQDSSALLFRGQYHQQSRSIPCMIVVAETQDDRAFRSLRFAAGAEPMQVIALHDGELVAGSGYQVLAAGLRAHPLQLDGQL